MYLLKAKKILTGDKNQIIENGEILIKENRIESIGKNILSSNLNNQDIQIIDLKDSFIMPGLIDSHVHLGFDGGSNPVKNMKNSSDIQLYNLMEKNAKTLLNTGVTTARDLGARSFLDVELKKMINNREIEGPNLLVSNRPITSPEGHCWFMGCECNDERSIQDMVNYHIEKGADWIKIMATGGGITEGTAKWENQFSKCEIRTAVNQTHNLNKKISAHAHGTSGIKNVTDSGVDTIEHCSWFDDTGIRYDNETTKKIVEKNIFVCPTINAKWKKIKGRMEERMPQLQKMRKEGVKFIFGTDAGITNVPHNSYVEGLKLMKEIGMTNEEVIESATSLAAEGLGIKKLTGSLEKGKRADIIAVKENPLLNLSNLDKLSLIMVNGKIYS